MQKKKDSLKKKATKETVPSNESMTWDGKSLVNNVVYVCDIETSKGGLQAFMFKPGKKTSKQYSVMTEFENVDGNTVVYNNGIGPDLTLRNIREATAEIREKFFNAAHESNLEFDSKQGVWNYTAAPNINSIYNPTIFLFEPTKSDDEVKSMFDDENIYSFITLNETENEYSEIIGEVKNKKGKIVYLDAWAYTSQPDVIRAPSQIIVSSQYLAPLSKVYKFSSACVSLLLKKDEQELPKNMHSKETKEAIVRFINRIINDSLNHRVYIVEWAKKYYVYPCYEECASLFSEALCEITKELEVVCPSSDLRLVFGDGVVISKEEYGQILQEAKERKEKETTQKISEAFEKAHNQESVQKENVSKMFANDGAEKKDAGESSVSSNIFYTKDNNYEFYTPGIYETSEKASMSLYSDVADDYFIINVRNDGKILFKLTDDAQSVLHSRHLNQTGTTCVFGPIRDAQNTYDYILDYLKKMDWTFDKTDSILYRNKEGDLGKLLKEIVDLQISVSSGHNGYRLIQPALKYFE